MIPASHNLGADRVFDLLLSVAYPTPSYYAPLLADGSTITRWIASSGLIDIELDPTITGDTSNNPYARALRCQMWAGGSGDTPDVGELWWTNVYQPVFGTAFGWEDFSDPVAIELETESGGVYANVKGEPKRRFTLDHRIASGADLAIYDDLRRMTGHGPKGFWFDHSDTADKVRIVHRMAATGMIGLTNMTEGFQTGPDGDDCLEFTTSGTTVNASADIDSSIWDAEGAAGTDWRNSTFQFDIYFDTSTAWVGSGSDLVIQLFDTNATQIASFQPFDALTNAGDLADIWYRVQMDVENDALTGSRSLDRSAIDLIRFSVPASANTAARVFRIAKPRIIDNSKQPVYCRVLPGSFLRQQESEAPGGAGGPRYRIEMTLEELTT